MYGHHTSYSGVCFNRVRLPILLVVSRTGKKVFLCPRSRLKFGNFGLARRVRLSRPVSAPRSAQAESGGYSRDSFVLLSATECYLFIIYRQPPSGQSRVYQVTQLRCRSLPRVPRHRASSLRGSSTNGCCLYRYHHGPINMRLSFSTPTIGM